MNIMNIFKKIDKKKLNQFLILLALGVLLVFMGNNFFLPETNKENKTVKVTEKTEYTSYENNMENRLKNVLGKVKGVGKIEVLLTISYGKELVVKEEVVQDESSTVEKDNEGGSREISSKSYENKTVMVEKGNGTKEPLVLKEAEPKIEGIVIVCEGGGDPFVKDALTRASMALLNLPAHKVEIFTMN